MEFADAASAARCVAMSGVSIMGRNVKIEFSSGKPPPGASGWVPPPDAMGYGPPPAAGGWQGLGAERNSTRGGGRGGSRGGRGGSVRRDGPAYARKYTLLCSALLTIQKHFLLPFLPMISDHHPRDAQLYLWATCLRILWTTWFMTCLVLAVKSKKLGGLPRSTQESL